jgi:hypothetical protein
MTNDTSTHQDHVIAHVIGATVLGYFAWDESMYLLLDIGFVWRIYLDCEMGLLPVGVTINELEADAELKKQLTAESDLLLKGVKIGIERMHLPPFECLIEEVALTGDEQDRTLMIMGNERGLAIHASVASREMDLREAS